MSSELGEIDPKQTEATFRRLQGKLGDCHAQGLQTLDYLAGDVQFFLRIGQDGRAKYAHLEESTLGDRVTERCMLNVLLSAAWPAPQGGEAEVRKRIGFDAPSDVRAPTEWRPIRVQGIVSQSPALEQCKQGGAGQLHVTAYVEPDGKDGRVRAVGVATADKNADAKVDCVVDAVKALKMPSPGSYAAKVTFSF